MQTESKSLRNWEMQTVSSCGVTSVAFPPPPVRFSVGIAVLEAHLIYVGPLLVPLENLIA